VATTTSAPATTSPAKVKKKKGHGND
jgi:hypothetical protein